jgi:hypothetical protein
VAATLDFVVEHGRSAMFAWCLYGFQRRKTSQVKMPNFGVGAL